MGSILPGGGLPQHGTARSEAQPSEAQSASRATHGRTARSEAQPSEAQRASLGRRPAWQLLENRWREFTTSD